MALARNSRVRRAWVLALRNGEFRQGTSIDLMRLDKAGAPRFSPLGVLAELAHRQGWVSKEIIPPYRSEPGFARYDGEYKLLPFGLAQHRLGITTDAEFWHDKPLWGPRHTSVLRLTGRPFSEVADMIETAVGFKPGSGVLWRPKKRS